MNESKVRRVEARLKNLLESDWFLVWRDMPKAEIPLTRAQEWELTDIMVDCGTYFNYGSVCINVTITPTPDVPARPWDDDLAERTKRNADIVRMRDELGLSYPKIGQRVGLSESGVRNAYLRGKEQQGENK